MAKKEYKFKNNLEELNNLADVLKQFAEEYNVDKQVLFDINLSLDELITNIISYGYDKNDGYFIYLSLECIDNVIKIELIDTAKEFNPLMNKEPDLTQSLEDKPIGGLGIHFVKLKMDEINYCRENDTNKLTLVKKINIGDNDGN